MESEAKNIDKYIGFTLSKRFDFLYENYSVLKPLIKNYREDIIMDVIDMKTCKRRESIGELGVRIQVSIRRGGPTEKQAISHMTVENAIEEGFLDEAFFEDIDNPDEIIRRVTNYHIVRADFEVFASKLETLNLEDQRVIKPYLLKQKSIDDFANDMGVQYKSAATRIYRIKKKLIDKVEPRMQKGA